MSKVSEWLDRVGLPDVSEAFEKNGITFDSLHTLTNEDMKELGVSKLIDRKHLLKEIEQLAFQRAQSVAERRLL